MRIAITPSSFAANDQTPLRKLEQAGCEIIPNPYGRRFTKEEVMELLSGEVDGLLAGLEPLDADVLNSAKQLKAIARVGIGVANVDFEAAEENEIKVSNTPAGPTDAVAEATLTSALTLLRGLIPRNEALHRREWPKHVVRGLKGLNVIFIGYGRIGRRTADLFRFMGAKIYVVDPFLNANQLEHGEVLLPLEEALPLADVVTLHAAGEDEILGGEQFKLLKKNAILLNPSRGELVNETALFEALDNGTVESCWFDAFWHEPYTGKLCDYPQALLTPHACTYTQQCRLDMESQAVENLLNDLGLKK